MKHAVVAEFKAVIRAAEEGLANGTPASNPVVREAYEFRDELHKAEFDPAYLEQRDVDGEVIADGATFVRSLIADRAEELSRGSEDADAVTFSALALGKEVPLLHYVDTWLAEAQMKARQKTDYRRAVTKLDSWLRSNKRRATIEAMTVRLAGEYVTKTFAQRKVNTKTANKDISCLSSYWRWLIKKGHSDANPWKGQSFAKTSLPRNEKKQAFTDEEVSILLAGKCKPLLHDFMRTAALSGMRIEEIARLRTEDIKGGAFEIHKAKTEAGERSVPIHQLLADLVQRRCEGKYKGEYLFHELPIRSEDSKLERSQAVVKAFVYYRRSLKVDDVVNDRRQSRIDFHSFRRWFAAKAVQALNAGATGFNPWTLAEVIGHKLEDKELGMTMGVYAGPSDAAAKVACVGAVQLPAIAV